MIGAATGGCSTSGEINPYRTPTSSSPTSPTSRTPTPEEIKQQQQEQERERQQRQQAQEQERKAEAARLDPMNYTLPLFDDHAYAVIIKDPDSHIGEKLQIFGVVTQFDPMTGNSAFLADTGTYAWPTASSFHESVLIEARNPAILADVVKGDLVRMYVEVEGTATYRTGLGIKRTVPAFTVNIIDSCPLPKTLKPGPSANYPGKSLEPACE